jgi:hypothetical protein
VPVPRVNFNKIRAMKKFLVNRWVSSVVLAVGCAGFVGCQDGGDDRPDRKVGFRPAESAVNDDLLPPVDNTGLAIAPDPDGSGTTGSPGNFGTGGVGGSAPNGPSGQSGAPAGGRTEYQNPSWLDEAQRRLQSQANKPSSEAGVKTEGTGKTDSGKTTAAPKKSPVYAKKVPGKPGVVWNPFVPGEMLDVSDLPPGAEARDPKTGGTFLVP